MENTSNLNFILELIPEIVESAYLKVGDFYSKVIKTYDEHLEEEIQNDLNRARIEEIFGSIAEFEENAHCDYYDEESEETKINKIDDKHLLINELNRLIEFEEIRGSNSLNKLILDSYNEYVEFYSQEILKGKPKTSTFCKMEFYKKLCKKENVVNNNTGYYLGIDRTKLGLLYDKLVELNYLNSKTLKENFINAFSPEPLPTSFEKIKFKTYVLASIFIDLFSTKANNWEFLKGIIEGNNLKISLSKNIETDKYKKTLDKLNEIIKHTEIKLTSINR